jgi:hypothetical protein
LSNSKSDPLYEKCPGCDVSLPFDDPHAQIIHMMQNHPEIIHKRLVDAGERPDIPYEEWLAQRKKAFLDQWAGPYRFRASD